MTAGRGAYGGFVALHRALLESDVLALRPAQFKVFVIMLIKANWEAKTWVCPVCKKTLEVPRGGVAFSQRSLAALAGPGVGRGAVRRAQQNLIEMGTIEAQQKAQCHGVHVFVNYDKFNPIGDCGPGTRPNTGPVPGPVPGPVNSAKRPTNGPSRAAQNQPSPRENWTEKEIKGPAKGPAGALGRAEHQTQHRAHSKQDNKQTSSLSGPRSPVHSPCQLQEHLESESAPEPEPGSKPRSAPDGAASPPSASRCGSSNSSEQSTHSLASSSDSGGAPEPKSKPIRKSRTRKTKAAQAAEECPVPEADRYALIDELRRHVLAVDPDSGACNGRWKTERGKWSGQLQRALADGTTMDRLREALVLAFADPFWRGEVSAMAKLIKHADTICQKARAKGRRANGSASRPLEFGPE